MSETSGSFEQTRYSPLKVPILEIAFSVSNNSGKVLSKTEKFWVDSGFDGDLKMPQSLGNQLKGMQMPFVNKLGGVASGSAKYELFKAKIITMKLNGLVVNNDEIDCVLACFGTNVTPPLVGLNAISKWKTCLDIPNGVLTIS